MGETKPVPPIVVCAACLFNEAGNLLLVRKRGTRFFMLPGGKPEPCEGPETTVLRELEEELGIRLQQEQLGFLAVWVAPAANEDGRAVEAAVWRGSVVSNVRPASEIEEVVWIDPLSPPPILLAPLLIQKVLPFLQDASMG